MKADVTAERVARNQSTFRDANEQLERNAEQLAPTVDRVPFICECPDVHCRTIALLSLVDYEMVRSRGDWFFTVPGHESCVVDGEVVAKILKRNEAFSVMEKIGPAGERAEQLDPRG
jgi:hypothetical protein